MSGALTHSPADVLRRALIASGDGTDPTDAGSWPVFVSQEPDSPDNCITLYDTGGIKDGRVQTDGEVQEHPGFLLRVRSATFATGYTKAHAVAVAMDGYLRTSVTVSSSTYELQAVTRTTNVIHIGEEEPGSRRSVFTVNGIMDLRQTA